MERLRNYTIGADRLQASCLVGMERQGGKLTCSGAESRHLVFLGEIDGMEKRQQWGRFCADIRLEENMSYCLHAAASDIRVFDTGEQVRPVSEILLEAKFPADQKRQLFEALGEQTFINQQDVLLYELSGRYLWLYIEIFGTGCGTIAHACIQLPGDNFMDTYPQIYREWGSFFHRYLSIFSSLFQDFNQEIKRAGQLLDVQTAPAELLPELISWLGIDVSGNFLDEATLRTLAQEGYDLNRKKGTKWAIARLAQIVLGESVILVEKGFQVTLLIRSYVEEKKSSQLLFLLRQFLPVRCRIGIVYLEPQCNLNTHCYLDLNAGLYRGQAAVLDGKRRLQNHLMLV